MRRFQVPGPRCQVPGVRCQVPGFHVPYSRDDVSNFRDLVPRQNVENLYIKIILRLNGNYEPTNTFFTTLIFSLARFKRKKNISSFYDNGTRNKEI